MGFIGNILRKCTTRLHCSSDTADSRTIGCWGGICGHLEQAGPEMLKGIVRGYIESGFGYIIAHSP